MEQDLNIIACDPGLFHLHMLQYHPYSNKALPLYLHMLKGISKLRYLIYQKTYGNNVSFQQLLDETRNQCIFNFILLSKMLTKWSMDHECLFLLPKAQYTKILRRTLKTMIRDENHFSKKMVNWFSLLYTLSVFALHDIIKKLIKHLNVRLYYVDECLTSQSSQIVEDLGYQFIKNDTTKIQIQKDGYVLAWYDKNEISCLNILYHFRKEIKDIVIADDANFVFYHKKRTQILTEFDKQHYDKIYELLKDKWYFNANDIVDWVNI